MSVALFDLGQRLRAATLGRPVARCAFAPVLPPVHPIAVTLSGAGEGALVRATDGVRLTSASGPAALQVLADLGLGLAPEPRTLIIPDRNTLGRLLEVARATERDAPTAAVAAVVGWWEQRAAHPGTGAVLEVTSACTARWALGVPPAEDRDLTVWRHWLGDHRSWTGRPAGIGGPRRGRPDAAGPGGLRRTGPRLLGVPRRAAH